MDTLFPMLFTLIAAAIDPKNNTSSGSKFFFIARAQIESIASPAPTLSRDCAAKAGQDTGFESFLKSVAPFFPFVIIKFRGPIKKWSVLRKGDNAVLREGINSKEEIITIAQELSKTLG